MNLGLHFNHITGGTHRGMWTWSGSVPANLCDFAPATQSDIMGGRLVMGSDGQYVRNDEGRVISPRNRYYSSIAEAEADAIKHGIETCNRAGCCCRTPKV